MGKSALFIDLDNTKFDTIPAHVSYFNEKYQINSIGKDYANNPPLNLVLNAYLPQDKWVTREEAYRDATENFLHSMEHHKDILPMPYMAEVISLLAEKYVLWTVTARPKNTLDVIKYLIDRHIPNCISGIHCVWNHEGNGIFIGTSKRDFIEKFEGEKAGFIDDSATEILEMQDILPSYLFDPLGLNNSIIEIRNRVRSWEEIGNTFL